MNKRIYSIKLKAVLKDNSILECRKVGDAIDTEARLHQHENAVTQRFENMIDLPIQGRRDYAIHEILKSDPLIQHDGEANEGYFTGREVFYMKDGSDPSYIDKVVSKWASGSLDLYKRDLDIIPYKKQQEIIDAVFALFITGNIKALIEAAPRTGKSFMALCIAHKLEAKKILILTPFPDADGSFKSVILRHIMFPDAVFHDARTMDEVKFSSSSNVEVIMMSWQLLDDEKKHLASIFSDQIDFVVVDETHRTSDTRRSEDLLSKINHTYELHLSGTPYNDKLNGRFTSENTFTYDFIDRMLNAQEAKLMLLKKLSNDEKKSYEFLASSPNVKFLMIDRINDAVEEYKKKYPNFNVEDNLTPEKFFTRKYEQIVKIFFRGLNITTSDPLASSIMSGDFADEFNHILMIVSTREDADFINEVLTDLINENGGWGGYKIFNLSGIKTVDDFNSVEKYVNKNQEENGKTIHISVGKATTGVTLDRLSSVWIMKSIKSAELFVQVSLRIGTPFEGKENVNIICFDSEQTLTVQSIISQMRARITGESLIEVIRTLNRCLPTLVYNGIDFTPINGEEILNFSREIFNKKISNSFDFVDEISVEAMLELAQFAGLNVKEFSRKIGLGGQEGGKTESIEINGTRSKGEKIENEINKIREQIEYVLSHLDHIMAANPDVKNVDDISNLDEIFIGNNEISNNTWNAIVNAIGKNSIQIIIDQILIKNYNLE